MEPWLIWAIFSALGGGLYSFSQKIVAERKYNFNEVSFYTYIFVVIFTFINFIFTGYSWDNFLIISLLGFLNAIFLYTSFYFKNISLKSIDSVIFFPIYKVFGPIIVTLISIFYFQEIIGVKEIIGITLGITIPLLLITRKESKKQNDLKKGIIFLLYTVIFAVIATVFVKEANVRNLNINLLVFINTIFGLVISGSLFYYKKVNSKKKNKVEIIEEKNKKEVWKFSFISAIFYAFSAISFQKAFAGNMAVVYTINSFSILIPIVLSIIFYNDHFDKKKAFVIFLSIVSILFFIH